MKSWGLWLLKWVVLYLAANVLGGIAGVVLGAPRYSSVLAGLAFLVLVVVSLWQRRAAKREVGR